MKNIDLVRTLCALLDEAKPRTGGSYASLITFVKDRPGHDRRYAIDSGKIRRELGWRPQESFESGLREDGALVPGADWRRGRHEGHHPRGRLGHAALPGDAGGLQAAPAGVRQADGVLPALHADARGHPRHPGDLHAAGHAAVRRAARRRPQVGHQARATRCSRSRRASRRPSSSASSSSARTRWRWSLGDNLFHGHDLSGLLKQRRGAQERAPRCSPTR